MTAKEMFNRLGWEYNTIVEEDYIEIYYIKNNCNDRPITNEIDFRNKKMFITGTITLKELKAINKQIEELGWEN